MRIDVFKKEKPKEHFPIFVPVEKSSYIISPLDVKSEYYVILRLCNEVACSSSQRRFISIVKKGRTSNLNTGYFVFLMYLNN